MKVWIAGYEISGYVGIETGTPEWAKTALALVEATEAWAEAERPPSPHAYAGFHASVSEPLDDRLYRQDICQVPVLDVLEPDPVLRL